MHTDEGGGDGEEGDTSMLLQPETKPITQEQLVNEVKGIYAGLVVSSPSVLKHDVPVATLSVITFHSRATWSRPMC